MKAGIVPGRFLLHVLCEEGDGAGDVFRRDGIDRHAAPARFEVESVFAVSL
jgi:hypothetical protein